MVAFIYADLIVIPLIWIYRKYYGTRPALLIALLLFISMVLAGILVDGLFSLLHLVPTGPRPANAVSTARFSWNYTTFLDIAAIVWAGWLVWLHRSGAARSAHEHEAHEHGIHRDQDELGEGHAADHGHHH